MKMTFRKHVFLAVLGLGIALLPVAGQLVPVQTSPSGQRSAMGAVQSQVSALQNATQSAPNFVTGGYDMVWQQFQSLRNAFNGLAYSLSPQQAANGANEMAELSSGLDIIQEAFGNYQNDVASGRSPNAALDDMCQVLYQASGVWLQEFNQDCSRMGVGW